MGVGNRLLSLTRARDCVDISGIELYTHCVSFTVHEFLDIEILNIRILQ